MKEFQVAEYEPDYGYNSCLSTPCLCLRWLLKKHIILNSR